jgi:hypothetical protein
MTVAWKVIPRKRNVVEINRLCAIMSETNYGLFLKQTVPFFYSRASNTNIWTHVVRSVNDPVQLCQFIFLQLRIYSPFEMLRWISHLISNNEQRLITDLMLTFTES